MAPPRNARLVGARPLSARARLLDFEVSEGELGFVGGQYLIFDTGLLREDGRRIKRAYSILSSDSVQRRFEIAVLSLGAGSAFFQRIEPGAEVAFSGPWGQLLPDDARPRRTLFVATDTGITAALGLARGRGFAVQRGSAQLVWLVEDGYPFLPAEEVRAACAALGLALAIEPCPPVRHPERLPAAQAALRRASASGAPESAFLSGDGALVHALRGDLIASGVAPDAIRLECFFDNPQRKVPA